MRSRELLTAFACCFVPMLRDEPVAGAKPQWRSAALPSVNLTAQRFPCVASLVFTLGLNQIFKNCWDKSCVSSSGKAPQNCLALYWYRWQDRAVIPGCCSVQKGAPCPREGCRRVLWSGVFPQSLLISCLERSWIYFTASADKQFSCSFCAGLVGKSCTGVAGRAWFCLGMVHRPLSLLLPSHTLDCARCCFLLPYSRANSEI